MTNRSDTWIPVQDDTLMSLDQTDSGIDDVHSGSQHTATDGTSYSPGSNSRSSFASPSNCYGQPCNAAVIRT